MTQKPKMMQFLRKLQEIQQKYADTVSLEIRVRNYRDGLSLAIIACFISETRTEKEEDGSDSPYIANLALYRFYSVKENKANLDTFIKDVKRENQLIRSKAWKHEEESDKN